MQTTEARSGTSNRILSVEVLRVVSMLGIAVFHTFQPWVEYFADGTIESMPVTSQLLIHPVPLTILGCIDQLGAWGNHVFIMISGCFLLPKAIRQLRKGEEGRRLMREDTARRITHTLGTVCRYALIALVVSRWYPDATSASLESIGWLAQGLQFIWVYLLFVLLCPTIAQLWDRVRHPERLLALAAVLVYAVNLYIAFVSPGDSYRELWEWRKLMSGVTYGVSFVIGGWIGLCRERGQLSRQKTAAAFVASVGATVAMEVVAACREDQTMLLALSYKSTSPFACVMAASELCLALAFSPTSRSDGRALRATTFLTSGMLGFYVLQSLFSRGWHLVSQDLLYRVVGLLVGPFTFFATGILFSVMLFVLCAVADAFVRVALAALQRTERGSVGR